MKKVIKLLLIVVVSLFIFTSCGLSEEDKKIAKEYEKTSKGYAVDYIKDKYGITAEATHADAQVDTYYFDSSLSGEVIVTMKYKKTKFYVKLNAENNYEPIGDTYQNPTIEEGLKNKLKDIFGQEPIYFKSNLVSKNYKIIEYNLEYYDGTNIENFYLSFEAGVVNYNQENKDAIPELEKMTLAADEEEDYYNYNSIKIYNYKSKKAYEKAKKVDSGTYIGEKEAIYLKGFYETNAKNVSYETIDIKEDDIVLVIKDHAHNRIYSTTDYSYEEVDDDIIEKMVQYYDKKPKFIINAIKVEGKGVDIKAIDYIYLSKEKYKKYNDLIAFYYCKDTGYQDSKSCNSVGDYYYSYFITGNCKESYYLFASKTK